jgi:four helix bundle protein
MSEKDLKLRTKEFALRVIRMYSKLSKGDTVVQVLGKQVLRSGTSVGANYREVSRGRSKAEFISKIGDCLKEIEETEYWLELLVDSGCVSADKMSGTVLIQGLEFRVYAVSGRLKAELRANSGQCPMSELLDETRQLIAIFTTIDKKAKS